MLKNFSELEIECSLFSSPVYQNNYLSNDEESVMLDLRDHSYADYGNRRVVIFHPRGKRRIL